MTTTTTVQGEQRVLLRGVRWPTYVALNDDVESPASRLIFFRGDLEIMTTSFMHERLKTLIGRLIVAYTEIAGLPIISAGGTTMRSVAAQTGVEPDASFYTHNRDRLPGDRHWDAAQDPPPDLIVEVEISRTVVPRLPVYAALGVPEVWRLNQDSSLTVWVAEGDAYQQSPTSYALPGFPVDGIRRFLEQRDRPDDNALVQEFREWVASVAE